MKALNHTEIYRSYAIFIGYFSALLIATVLCWYLTLQTEICFAESVRTKKQEVDFFNSTRLMLSNKIDSIHIYMTILNTQMVANDGALQRHIIRLKDASVHDLDVLAPSGDQNHILYKKVLLDVEQLLEAKQVLQQAKEEEEVAKRKLQECTKANVTLRNR